ncbi:MAG: transglycosylase family protein, partial [Actinomycetota bacterium]
PPTTAPPPPPPAPAPAPSGPGNGDPEDPASWDRLAGCESGGNWAINTGNGYYGGLQFSLSSWQAVGGTGYPHEHSRETQIEMGKRLYYSGGGWSHWPGCTSSFGWR